MQYFCWKPKKSWPEKSFSTDEQRIITWTQFQYYRHKWPKCATLAQLVERANDTQEVMGSSNSACEHFGNNFRNAHTHMQQMLHSTHTPQRTTLL